MRRSASRPATRRFSGTTSTTRSSAASPATATRASRGSRRSRASTRGPSRSLVADEPGFQRWHGGGAVGYLVLGRVVDRQLAQPPEHARLVVCDRTFPTGMLGHHVRRLADAGLLAVLTATSPARLGPPGGPKLTGTNPLAFGVPSSDGEPVVVDVSMGAVTWGDVLAGLAPEEELVPFGGDQWHKAFALAVGLQLLVDSLVAEPGHGAVLLVARPEADPVPLMHAHGVRLPGSS